MNPKIFIACPITKHLTDDGMNADFEKFIKSVHELCNNYSNNIFMALFRENYGKARMEDEVCTPLDFEEMCDTDIVIAIPEDSQGVAVEIGWASAMKKRLMLVLNENQRNSPLINAIGTVTDTYVYRGDFDKEYIRAKDEIIKEIDLYLSQEITVSCDERKI